MSKKFDLESARVYELAEIQKTRPLTHAEKLELLTIYQTPFHDSGKIRGIKSMDSSCHGCEFCNKMRKFAEEEPACICGECYDDAQESRWKNVENRHGLNMFIMSNFEFTVEELAMLDLECTPMQKLKAGISVAEQIVRQNSSGDITGRIMAGNYLRTIIAHPNIHIALWAKNVAPVDAAIDEICGGVKPANMVFIRSSVLIGIPAKHCKYSDYIFTVYPDKDTLMAALKDGGCECNGKECPECGFKCYLRKWANGANICELLRCPEKDRQKYVDAYKKLVAKMQNRE